MVPHDGYIPAYSVIMKNFDSFNKLELYLKGLKDEILESDYEEYIDPYVGYDVKCH